MQISTKGLLYDPYSETLVDDMSKYEEFNEPTGHLVKEKVLRFIIFMYDMQSEMRLMFPDWQDRKIKCVGLAGWESDKNGRFADTVMAMLEGRDPVVNDMITKFCLLFPSPYYSAYIATWELLAREVRTSMGDTNDSKVISTMRSNIKELTKQIDEYSEKIFGGESTIGLKNSLYKSVDKARLRLRPEIVARDIQNKNLQIKDPYYEEQEIVYVKPPKPKLIKVVRGKGRPKKYYDPHKKPKNESKDV